MANTSATLAELCACDERFKWFTLSTECGVDLRCDFVRLLVDVDNKLVSCCILGVESALEGISDVSLMIFTSILGNITVGVVGVCTCPTRGDVCTRVGSFGAVLICFSVGDAFGCCTFVVLLNRTRFIESIGDIICSTVSVMGRFFGDIAEDFGGVADNFVGVAVVAVVAVLVALLRDFFAGLCVYCGTVSPLRRRNELKRSSEFGKA